MGRRLDAITEIAAALANLSPQHRRGWLSSDDDDDGEPCDAAG